MRPAVFFCVFLPLLLRGQTASGQTLIQTDFSGEWVAVTNNAKGSGQLPRGWQDNSSWAALRIKHEKLEEEGAPFLRTTVGPLESGWGQLQHSLPRVIETAYYRLRIRVRSLDGLAATAGIRRTGSPYTYLWQESLSPDTRWREYVFYKQLTPADFDVAFYIAINGEGSFDISSFTLDRLTEQQLIDELRKNATGLPKNLLRNTRFPLGLPGGWTLDRDNSDGDAVRVDPDGEALHIDGSQPWTIYSEPFAVPVPKSRYTLSFSARGNAGGRLQVINDGAVVATAGFRAEAEARRFSVSFTAPVLSRAQALRVEASGEIWLRDFQLEEGAAATVFEPPACELHFGAPTAYRTVFDDEDLPLRFVTLGGAECARVQLRMEDLSGAVTQPEAGATSGDLAIPSRLGAYRVEGWVEDEGGTRRSPYQEMTVFRLRRPRYWMRDAPDSPFGVHTNSTTRHIQMAKAAGINWTRLHDAGLQYIGWYHLERKPGEWTFYDDAIRRYRKHGMKILGLLSTAPEWASYFDKPRNGYFDRFYQPRDLGQFTNYVRTVVERYREEIDTWDVWNEPWNVEWWAVAYNEAEKKYVTSAEPQADYARLQRAAAETVKQVEPAMPVLGVNSTTGATGTAWTKGIVAASGLDASDIHCYHQYTNDPLGFPNDAVERGWRDAMLPAMFDGAPEREVWMTEGSPVYSMSGAGFYRRILPYGDDEKFNATSDRMVRFVTALLAQHVRKVFLYSMHSHDSLAGAPNPWRVIVGRDGYLHPNAAAHSALAWFLEDKRFAERVELAPSVTAYLFEDDERSVAVLAPRPSQAAEWAPAGLPRFDLYGNPLEEGAPLGRFVSYVTHEGSAASLAQALRGAK